MFFLFDDRRPERRWFNKQPYGFRVVRLSLACLLYFVSMSEVVVLKLCSHINTSCWYDSSVTLFFVDIPNCRWRRAGYLPLLAFVFSSMRPSDCIEKSGSASVGTPSSFYQGVACTVASLHDTLYTTPRSLQRQCEAMTQSLAWVIRRRTDSLLGFRITYLWFPRAFMFS